ncbi:hypothetical protein L6452_38625 [Arctium lappa]|uniref:Uncharacterized protein n=1 Tax=Arctium lappa TaxID=4217 RepID=A0ACB8XQ09_ARCLA|nr:hypothetical protein L6452_38625 [Arctium lappa]
MVFAYSPYPATLCIQDLVLSSTIDHRLIFSVSFNRLTTSYNNRHTTVVLCCALQMENMATSAKEAKLWEGRFEEGVTDAVERFTESVSFDKALYKHNIMGSRAHASMLANHLDRDVGHLLDCRVRLNFFPLSACALAGIGLPIYRS